MKKLLTGTLLVVSLIGYAQDVDLANSQLNINLLPLTLSYEAKLDDNLSITLGAGLGYTAYYSNDSFSGEEAYFIALPIFYSSFRNYYSRKNIKKSNLKKNSGNYFGVFSSYQGEALGEASSFSEAIAYLETSNIYTVGPVWGIERNYASGIHFGLSIGPGLIGGKYIEPGVTVVGEFELGFTLFQK